ncbi:MAG: Bug family tripartite tricarboxylate transporter substrate binding protein [Beijerinckiaceae bacterium]
MANSVRMVALVSILAVLPTQTPAQTAIDLAQYYKGKTIRVIVGYSPGGGYDAYSRLLSEHLHRFIPGGPSIVVQYMPGAATELATAYILNAAPQDGTVIGIPVSSLPMSNTLFPRPGQKNIDVSKMRWIGRLDAIDTVAIVAARTGVSKVEDTKKIPVVFGATAKTSATYIVPLILNRLGKGNFKIVLGYRGTTGAYLAMERREIDGMHNGVWSQLKRTRKEWIRDKSINVIYQHALQRSTELPDVPTIVELGQSDEDRRMFSLFASESTLGRTFYVSDGIPRKLVSVLRQAFSKMVVDAVFLAAAKKLDMPINPLSGEELDKVVADIVSAPPQLIKRIRKLTAE